MPPADRPALTPSQDVLARVLADAIIEEILEDGLTAAAPDGHDVPASLPAGNNGATLEIAP